MTYNCGFFCGNPWHPTLHYRKIFFSSLFPYLCLEAIAGPAVSKARGGLQAGFSVYKGCQLSAVCNPSTPSVPNLPHLNDAGSRRRKPDGYRAPYSLAPSTYFTLHLVKMLDSVHRHTAALLQYRGINPSAPTTPRKQQRAQRSRCLKVKVLVICWVSGSCPGHNMRPRWAHRPPLSSPTHSQPMLLA